MYDMRHLDKFHALEVHTSAAMKAFLVFDKAEGVGGDPCGAITKPMHESGACAREISNQSAAT